MSIEDEVKQHYIESKRIINEAQSDGQLVLFVGAGASISAGMPSWKNAIETIASRLGINKLSSDDYLRIPQYYYNARDKKEYTQLMQDVFHYRHYLQNQPVHDLIIKFNTQTIITTNYDHLLEQAAEHNSEMIKVVSKDSDLPYRKGGRELIKMHGDFENDNFVLKEEDYLAYSRNFKLIENYIKSIIGTKVVLFIGYSFNDPDVKHIFSWAKDILHGDFQNAYLINTHDDFDIDVEKYYKNFGINVLYSSVQLGHDHRKKDETSRLESMLKWLLERGRTTKLDDLYDKVRVFRDFNYAYASAVEYAFRNLGYRIERGYISLESIPIHSFNYNEDYELLDHIIRAIAYERYVQNANAVYVATVDNDKAFYSIEKEYEAPYEERESIRGLLDVLNKSGLQGLIFFVPIDEKHPHLDNEELFAMNYHRVFVEFTNSDDIPEWLRCIYTFNDTELRKIIDNNIKRLNENTPDLYMEQAGIYSYFEELQAAYNCLKTAARLYYKRGESVKYFIAETDRYYIGKLIKERGYLFGLTEREIDKIGKEIDAINLDMTYWSLPDLGKGSGVLKDICSFDISFKLFQNAYSTSEQIKEQAATRYYMISGLPAFSAMRREVLYFHNFESRNYIILDRYRENNLIYKLYFQSILASVLAPDLGDLDKEWDSGNVHADSITNFELYIALKYLTYRDLQKLLMDVKRIPISESGIDYLREVLKCIDKPHTEWLVTQNSPFWKIILLMGHIEMDQNMFGLAIEKVTEYVRGTDYREYKNAIIKLVDNAETLRVIGGDNTNKVRNLLNDVLLYLANGGQSEERTLRNLISFLTFITHIHGAAFDDRDIIKKLFDNGLQILCVENYLFLGKESQKAIEEKFKEWMPEKNAEDYILYCIAVGNDVITPNETIEIEIVEFIKAKKYRIDEEKVKTQSKEITMTFGEVEPDYIQLLRLLCNLYLRDHLVDKERFIENAERINDSFSLWLINLETFDYSQFKLEWLDLCNKPLLDKIGKNEKAREEISEVITDAYNLDRLDKKMLNKYFKYFSCKKLTESE